MQRAGFSVLEDTLTITERDESSKNLGVLF